VTTENLFELTDYAGYKKQFLNLFGFERADVNYDEDVATDVFDCVELYRAVTVANLPPFVGSPREAGTGYKIFASFGAQQQECAMSSLTQPATPFATPQPTVTASAASAGATLALTPSARW
jgi:hypothetical protein